MKNAPESIRHILGKLKRSHEGNGAVSAAHAAQEMQQWYGGRLGALLREAEQAELENILPGLFGYHLVQVGLFADAGHLGTSPIRHHVTIDAYHGPSEVKPACYATPSELPVATDSVDVVILAHALELDPNPHQALREAERVLIPEGHVVIVGFNPWSLWGMRRLAAPWNGSGPWRARFLRMSRLKDWLSLLGFDVVQADKFFYRPPVAADGLQRKLQFLERVGQYAWPVFGGAYVVVAKKRVSTLTPIRPIWRRPKKLVKPGLAQTPNRGMHRK